MNYNEYEYMKPGLITLTGMCRDQTKSMHVKKENINYFPTFANSGCSSRLRCVELTGREGVGTSDLSCDETDIPVCGVSGGVICKVLLM